jgi:hypothetical protein
VQLAMIGDVGVATPSDNALAQASEMHEPETISDAPAVADRFHIDIAEAERRLAIQSEFDAVTEDLRTGASEYFAGAAIVHEPAYELHVFLTPNVPEYVYTSIPTEIEGTKVLTSTPTQVSEVERFAMQDAAAVTLERQGQPFGMFTAQETGAVIVEVGDKQSQQAAEQLLAPLFAGSKVTLRVDVVPNSFETQISRGGLKLEPSGCTSSFTVINPSDNRLGSTAGHCGSMASYFDVESGNWENASYVNGDINQWGDVKFYDTLTLKTASFEDGDGFSPRVREVHSVKPAANMNEGDVVCVNGRTSGYDCTYVRRVNAACGDFAVTHFVETRDRLTTLGDSGAPWFLSNQAWGIHSGNCTRDGQTYSDFTKAVNIDETLPGGYHVMLHAS